MPDWNQIRDNYPLAAEGRYYNTASFGSISLQTIEKQKEHLDEILLTGNGNYAAWEKEYYDLKLKFSEFLNCKSKNIGFFPDTSLGINKVAELFDPKQKVILIEEDFPSVTLPWITRKFDICWISYEDFAQDHLSEIEDQLKAGAEVLCLSYVFYNHGFRIDPNAVGQLCNKYNCKFILDATQALGTCHIDPGKAHVDFMIASCFKWFLAGYGSSIAYVSDSFLGHFSLKHSGWNTMKNFIGPVDEAENYKIDAARFEVGHIKFHNLNMLANSFDELNAIGFENIASRTRELIAYLREKLSDTSQEVLTPESANPSAIISIRSNEQLLENVKKAGVRCSPRKDYVRFAVYFYNNEEDIDVLVRVLG